MARIQLHRVILINHPRGSRSLEGEELCYLGFLLFGEKNGSKMQKKLQHMCIICSGRGSELLEELEEAVSENAGSKKNFMDTQAPIKKKNIVH